MMKNIFYFLSFLFFAFVLSFSVKGQRSKIVTGKKAYSVYNYEKTIRELEPIKEKNIELNRILADSYLKTGDYLNAERYFQEIATSGDATPEDIYSYAYVLKINRKYDEFKEWMKKYTDIKHDDRRANLFMQDTNIIGKLLTDKNIFKVEYLTMNSRDEDFGPVFYQNKYIVFTSTRTFSRIIKRIWSWNNKTFLDLFIADIDSLQLSNIRPFCKKFNKKYHEGPASFNEDGTFMAYTLNNYGDSIKNHTIYLEIYTTQLDSNNTWSQPVAFPYNSVNFSVGQPSLTPDGKRIYFASDMPGGYGGTDIYYSDRNDDGSWGTPVNLGETINTEGNEMFPFIYDHNLLFFASDGLPGIGGLDIFFSRSDRNVWSKPRNLGTPINSSYDDFAFVTDKNLTKGYFSSNRKYKKGDDDIYAFRVLKNIFIIYSLQGKITDSNNNKLSDIYVYLLDNNRCVDSSLTDRSGQFYFQIDPHKDYVLSVNHPDYFPARSEVFPHDSQTITRNIRLARIPGQELICKVIDADTKDPINGVEVSIEEIINNQSRNLTTKENGITRIKQSLARVGDSLSYTLSFHKKGYAPKTTTYKCIISDYNPDTIFVKLNKISVGQDLGKLINLNPIYFDLNKYNIRPDAAIELDKIVKIMNEYPKMVIELSSHTDCRGSSKYNLILSDKRAKASAAYIKKRITNPERIYGKGYGEEKPVVKCKCSECSEEQHQKNRRTEFKIIRM